jgi:hypothetical protein
MQQKTTVNELLDVLLAGINYTVYTSMLRYLKVKSSTLRDCARLLAWFWWERAQECCCALQADAARPHLASVALSAGTAGVVLSSVLSPFELIKVHALLTQLINLLVSAVVVNIPFMTPSRIIHGPVQPCVALQCRMQMAHRNVHGGAKPPYSSGITCLQHLLRTEGLRGLTRGTGATMARETPGNALFFTVYELLRRVVPGRPQSAAASGDGFMAILGDAASSIVCGGLAGTVMWAAVLPIDVAKTRIQTATPGTPRDVGVLRNLAMMHSEGTLPSLLKSRMHGLS